MINIYLQNSLFYFFYKIADNIYISDTEIIELGYLKQDLLTSTTFKESPQNHFFNKNIYNKKTLIGENIYPLEVKCDNKSNYKLQINSVSYVVTKDTISASIKDIDITILLGPVLILNLSINNTFCLHASAFILKDTLVIIMANSGTGKSTIARYMHQQETSTRIADDIVPLKIIDNKLTLLAKFPQLKLTQEQQYKGKNICQKTVFLFAKKATNTTIKPMDRFTSMKSLVKHTVATKIFAEKELQSHLTFCNLSSSQVDSYQLKYSHTKDSLQKLYNHLYEIC